MKGMNCFLIRQKAPIIFFMFIPDLKQDSSVRILEKM